MKLILLKKLKIKRYTYFILLKRYNKLNIRRIFILIEDL